MNEHNLDIETVIRRMAKEQLRRNGRCTISVSKIARTAAKECGLLEKYGRLSQNLYEKADSILLGLGGALWPDSEETGSGKRSYSSRIYSFDHEGFKDPLGIESSIDEIGTKSRITLRQALFSEKDARNQFLKKLCLKYVGKDAISESGICDMLGIRFPTIQDQIQSMGFVIKRIEDDEHQGWLLIDHSAKKGGGL